MWNSDIRISFRERVHGVYIGIHASIHDQYYNAVHKFDMALSVFRRVRTSLSLAMRVLVVNMFMSTLFSNTNRHFFMPRVLLQEIERKALRVFHTHHMDQIGNVLGSRLTVWHAIIPSRFEIVQCRLCVVCS